MNHMNLNSMRVFAVAARQGTFQHAADLLSISTGAVSQRIKQLERDLGTVLFERRPRGVALTEDGQTLFDAVDRALNIVATATSQIETPANQMTLHLGPSFATKWLMPRMHALKEAFPGISWKTEIHHKKLKRQLARNEIAFWPAHTPEDRSAQQSVCLCELQLVAVCSPTLVQPNRPLDLNGLLSFPLLQDAHLRWERLINDVSFAGSPSILNFGRSALAIGAACSGHGVAMVPTHMITDDLEKHRLIELWRHPLPSGEFLFLSWAKETADRSTTARFIDWVLAEFGTQTKKDCA